MKTEKILIVCDCNSVEEFKQKIVANAEKHNLEFLLAYEMEMQKTEDGQNAVAILFDDEMDICLEVLDWIKDESNYGSVCQLDTFIKTAEKPSDYKDDWDSMIGEYTKTRNIKAIEPILAFDPNCDEADPEWKETLVSYVGMVSDVFYFLLI